MTEDERKEELALLMFTEEKLLFDLAKLEGRIPPNAQMGPRTYRL